MASDISHELENPAAAAVRSASEVMAKLDSPQEKERFAQIIEGEIMRTPARRTIVKAIVEGYGRSVIARNSVQGRAVLEVWLPIQS